MRRRISCELPDTPADPDEATGPVTLNEAIECRAHEILTEFRRASAIPFTETISVGSEATGVLFVLARTNEAVIINGQRPGLEGITVLGAGAVVYAVPARPGATVVYPGRGRAYEVFNGIVVRVPAYSPRGARS